MIESRRPPDPVKRVVAFLWSDEAAAATALEALEELWGPIDHSGAARPFDETTYYEKEMGRGLQRRLVSFERLVPSETLADAKLACGRLEDDLCGPAGRRVNLDVGYVDLHKLVLASTKFQAQKIHLGNGVYADPVLLYRKGRFRPFEWTFDDFRDGRHDDDLLAIRACYLEQLQAR